MTVNPRVFEKNSKLKLSRYFSDNFKRSKRKYQWIILIKKLIYCNVFKIDVF